MSPFLFILSNALSGFIDMTVSMLYFYIMCGRCRPCINSIVYVTSYIAMEGVLFANTCFDPYFSGPAYYFYCIASSVLTLFLISLEYKDSIKHKIFVVCTFQVIAMISEVFGASLTSVFLRRNPMDDKLSVDIFVSKLIMCIIIFILYFAFSKDNLTNTPAHIIFVMYMPILSIFILYRLWNSGINDISDKDFALNLFLYTAITLANIINFVLLKILIKSTEVQEQKKALDNQIKLQEEKYDSAVASFKQVRALVHDTRKHDLYIRECAAKEKYYELKEYLDKRLSIDEIRDIPINTGNLAIDALINNCDSICKAKDIKLNLNIDVDTSLIPIDNYEINIILGNLLDNAVYYSGLSSAIEQPFIDVTIKTSPETFVINCRNTFFESSEKKDVDPLRGCGLQNVEKIVQLHFGILSYSCSPKSYECIVTIPINII